MHLGALDGQVAFFRCLLGNHDDLGVAGISRHGDDIGDFVCTLRCSCRKVGKMCLKDGGRRMWLLEGFSPQTKLRVKIAQLCNAESMVLYLWGGSHPEPDCLINCRYPAKDVGFDVHERDT